MPGRRGCQRASRRTAKRAASGAGSKLRGTVRQTNPRTLSRLHESCKSPNMRVANTAGASVVQRRLRVSIRPPCCLRWRRIFDIGKQITMNCWQRNGTAPTRERRSNTRLMNYCGAGNVACASMKPNAPVRGLFLFHNRQRFTKSHEARGDLQAVRVDSWIAFC